MKRHLAEEALDDHRDEDALDDDADDEFGGGEPGLQGVVIELGDEDECVNGTEVTQRSSYLAGSELYYAHLL